MNKFAKGDRVRVTIPDRKVLGQEGIVQRSKKQQSQVVLELWCRWGTYTNYFPLWMNNKDLEKVAV